MKRLLVVAALVLAVPASAGAPPILATQDAWPVWSPDGTKVAFTRLHPGRNLDELMVADRATHRVTRLAQNAFQLAPSWSPDGTRIAYQAGGDVWVTDLHGAKHRVGRGLAPAWGPQLARVDAGRLLVGAKAWATGVIGRPAWSPDGKRIAFQRADGIYVTDGASERRWASAGPEPGAPAWSPDGAQLAFVAGDAVWIASLGIVPPRAVARGRRNASVPSWAPDGASVAYTWQGGLASTTTAGTTTALARAAGLGAAYGPGGALAYPAPRLACPGHLGIRVRGGAYLSGSCVVAGTARADRIEGTASWGDVVRAGAGNDVIHANDRHTDRVDCGPGRDTVWADRTDRLAHCEVVHR